MRHFGEGRIASRIFALVARAFRLAVSAALGLASSDFKLKKA